MGRSKQLVAAVILCLLAASCSDEDHRSGGRGIGSPSPGSGGEDALPPIYTRVSKHRLNVFEKTMIAISMNDGNWSGADMAAYDSIVWHRSPDGMGEVFKDGEYRLSAGQGFHKPGKYEVFIEGYKDGRAYYKNKEEVEVYLEGDFMSVRWDDPGRIEYFPHFSTDYYLTLYYHERPHPAAGIRYQPERNPADGEESLMAFAESRRFLYDYITEVYGEPQFVFEGDDLRESPLRDEYKKRFLTPLGATYYDVPVALWDIGGSHIALVGSILKWTGEVVHYYRIVAEPVYKDL